MLQTLRSTHNQVPGMHLTTIPKIVLVPRKSHFPWWCNVPDVRVLAPPDAITSYSKNQECPDGYFDNLVSGVILRSLGRIEHGLCSNLGGSLGTPPLKPALCCRFASILRKDAHKSQNEQKSACWVYLRMSF